MDLIGWLDHTTYFFCKSPTFRSLSNGGCDDKESFNKLHKRPFLFHSFIRFPKIIGPKIMSFLFSVLPFSILLGTPRPYLWVRLLVTSFLYRRPLNGQHSLVLLGKSYETNYFCNLFKLLYKDKSLILFGHTSLRGTFNL